MIWGIEGIHAWTPPGDSEPAIELGRIKDAVGKAVWPRYRLRKVSGLMGIGDPEDNRDRPVGRIGEITRLSQRRGKTVTYEGVIQARTLKELREAEADLRAAFSDLETEGRMDVSPHPLDTQWAGVEPKFYEARPLVCDIVDSQDTQGWMRLFVVGVRMGDPRYFEEDAETSEVEIKETNVSYDFE